MKWGRSAADRLDVTAAQADIVQLAIAELGQGLAGNAVSVPSLEHGGNVAHGLNHPEDSDGAKRRRAGLLVSRHGGNPFKLAQIRNALRFYLIQI